MVRLRNEVGDRNGISLRSIVKRSTFPRLRFIFKAFINEDRPSNALLCAIFQLIKEFLEIDRYISSMSCFPIFTKVIDIKWQMRNTEADAFILVCILIALNAQSIQPSPY